MSLYHSSRADRWTQPRWTDQAARHHFHGRIIPMDRPTLLQRILGRR